MNLDDVAVLEGKVWHRGKGTVAHDEHMPARQLEEPLNIGDLFAAAIALPRQTAAEAELAAVRDARSIRVAASINIATLSSCLV
jgi:hypothetical protein